ncbi:SpoIIE family protein phosphatase [Streptomyces sp. TRM49041]|uniref:SpoIIE family protein phosphatase n=1 Tax=Streptomyces sp. TRM49041 TaxID=2603216 RepID=UPI0011EFE90F|nr:SpoIIE family protein phosphatase [Streptomyces sp. TRM49041]
MPQTPWRVGGAQRKGRREVQADAFNVGGDLATGRIAVAVADGIGDTAEAAEAARLATEEAAAVALTTTPEVGCMTARERLAASGITADASIVTALLDPAHSRVQITWAGLCRAYVLTTDGQLRRATYDHSLGERIRRHTSQRGPLLAYDRKVTRTIARHGFVTTSLPARGITSVLLSTDGIARCLDDSAIRRALEESDPQKAADFLADAADLGGSDNVTAVVLRRAG